MVRDIPIQYISGGVDVPNLREDLVATMAKRGMRCRCIRCREIGGDAAGVGAPGLMHRTYAASGAKEVFLSYEADGVTAARALEPARRKADVK